MTAVSGTDNIRRLIKTPLVIQGIVLSIAKNWMRENSEQFKYDDSPLDSKIHIDSAYKENYEVVQDRPGIFIKRGTYVPSMGKLGFDDKSGIGPTSIERSFLSACQVHIRCVSKIPGECEKIAGQMLCCLVFMKNAIKKDFCFRSFDVDSIGEVQQHEEYKEFYIAPISLSTTFYSSPLIVDEAAVKIKKIIFSINEECDIIAGADDCTFTPLTT